MLRFFLLISFTSLFGCQNLEPRRPINKQKQVFLKESAKRNKNIVAIEQALFQQHIEKEKKLDFNATPQGFWFAHQKKNKNNRVLPVKGDRVTFLYRIEDLNGNLLYDEKTLGEVSFFLDQEDLQTFTPLRHQKVSKKSV